MRLRTILFFFVLSFISIFPLSIKAQTAPLAVEEVLQFMDEYTARFMKMDIDAYMDLFSKEAVENRMLPYADIREAYEKMVAHTYSVDYKLEIDSIQTYTGSSLVSGRYELIQFSKNGAKKAVFHGDIQYRLIQENGSLKIRELNYGR